MGDDSVAISAATGGGVEDLLSMIEEILERAQRTLTLAIPYSEQSIINSLYSKYTVIGVEYLDSYVEVRAKLDSKGVGQYSRYVK